MENKINIAKLLKDCPRGMELDCTMLEGLEFDYINEEGISAPICCRLKDSNGRYKTYNFTKYGCWYNLDYAKCVIFPKGKTTWEGFVPPCKFKDGDILFVKSAYDWICIYKESKNDEALYIYIATPIQSYYTHIVYEDDPLCYKEDIYEIRLATEEEKAKLFQAIKDSGYKWNEETKTLENLPKFKVGDRVVKKNGICVPIIITGVGDTYYWSTTENSTNVLPIADQDDYELDLDKFDITTLKPFESRVLVRDINTDNWIGGFYSHYKPRRFYIIGNSYYYQCIPYEGNEHLLDTTKDCDEYYKTW